MSIQPKYREICRELSEEITSGVFAAGERIPTEQQLAKRFGVARQTVLKALDVMKHSGVIRSVQGKGTFVAVTHGRARRPDEQGRQIAYICSNLQDSIGHLMMVGAERAAANLGYSMIACATRYDSEREAEYLRRCRNNKVDGIILLPYFSNRELVRRCAAEIPMVCVDNGIDGLPIPVVATDNCRAMYEAVSHLIELGHVRIGFILSGFEFLETVRSVRERFDAYRRALADHGILYRPDYVSELGTPLAHMRPADVGLDLYAYPAMHRLMSVDDPPSAVVLLWDELAPGAIAAVRDGRRRIPEDFSLVGFNDDELCSLVTPKLTSVRQPAEEIGECAVRYLDGMIRRGEKPPMQTIIPSVLVKRASTSIYQPRESSQEMV